MLNNADTSHCTGCSACTAICKKQAVRLVQDSEGFYIPYTDTDLCVSCGLCEKLCPAIRTSPITNGGSIKAYAAYNKIADDRKASASGGVFAALAEEVLKSGGFVCGCVLDQELKVKHIVSREHEEVRRMQGSKYVQSDMADCISQVCDLLSEGEKVLFSGTACQAAGLMTAINANGISDKNLIIMDIVCHGVPSPRIWRDYVSFYEKRLKTRLKGYIFRGKKYGWGVKDRFAGYECTAISGMGLADRVSSAARLWDMILSTDLCVRKCCNDCKYANVNKPSDITVGDFWGIEKVMPEIDDGIGCSCVIVHTQKGLNALQGTNSLITYEVDVKDVTAKNPNLCRPTPKNPLREVFFSDYHDNGFAYTAKKYFGFTLKYRIKNLIKTMLFAVGLRKRL